MKCYTQVARTALQVPVLFRQFNFGSSRQPSESSAFDVLLLLKIKHVRSLSLRYVLQEYIRRVGAWQKVASLLSEIEPETCISSLASVPAVKAAAAAATGDGMSSANVKSVEIVSMERLLDGSLGGLSLTNGSHSKERSTQSGYYSPGDSKVKTDAASFLTARFVQQMQQFLTNSQLGQRVDGEQFKATCLQASALLISNMVLYSFPE